MGNGLSPSPQLPPPAKSSQSRASLVSNILLEFFPLYANICLINWSNILQVTNSSLFQLFNYFLADAVKFFLSFWCKEDFFIFNIYFYWISYCLIMFPCDHFYHFLKLTEICSRNLLFHFTSFFTFLVVIKYFIDVCNCNDLMLEYLFG